MYDLELDKVLDEVKQREAKKILIQLPDGLKPLSAKIVDELEEKTGADVFIWFSSCYGACDIPLNLRTIGIDLFIQWGHNKFIKTEW
jgi:2-(3-amino-3-carboxypropyl)histidine synthase